MPSEYEREIEEILQRMGDLEPRRLPPRRFYDGLLRKWKGFVRWLGSLPAAVAADQLMIAAIVALVAWFFMRAVFPSVAQWVGLAGVLMFLGALFLSFRQVWGGRGEPKRWRGRIIDMRDNQPTLGDRLILWFRRQFNH